MTTQARRFCFTLNNPEDDTAPACLSDLAQYAIWQKELAPTTGTPHLQGYVELKRPTRISQLIKVMQAHYTPCNGTQAQNIEYCSKPGAIGGPWEIGEKKQENGKRKDLALACELAKTGCSKRKLLEEHTEVFVKYAKGLDTVRTFFIEPRRSQTHGIYVFGPAFSGKTHLFKNKYPDAYFKDNGQWWDGYDSQSVVIWDEFDWSQNPINCMKQLLNHAPLKVPVKGGMVEFKAGLIVFLTNTKLDICYENQSMEDQRAWRSRIRSFKMEKRVLTPLPSPLWEERYGIKHTEELPDYTSFNTE